MRTLLIAMGLLAVGCFSAVPAQSSPSSTSGSATASVGVVPPSSDGSAPPTSGGTATPVRVLRFDAVQRLDAATGFVSVRADGNSAALLRTDDRGGSWRRLTLPADLFATQIAFVDAQNGWLVARTLASSPGTCRAAPTTCRSLVLTTSDGGRTWNERRAVPDDPDHGSGLVDLSALDASRAWVTVRTTQCDPGGCAHQIIGTDDGGASWRVLREPFTAGDIERVSAAKGWVLHTLDPARGTEILGTTDAGASWRAQVNTTLAPVQLVARSERDAWALFVDLTTCTASSCGKHELYRTQDGASWSSLGAPSAEGCGGHLARIALADAQTAWITVNLGAGGGAGSGGVLRTRDGGRTWSCQTSPANTVLLSAPDARDVWTTSKDRTTSIETLWASDDGGDTWHELNILVR